MIDNDLMEKFWDELKRVALEVIAEGKIIGFGYSMIEVKFKDGMPAVVVSSHTQSKLYKDDEDPVKDIMTIVQKTKQKGNSSFTIIREEDGQIRRVLLDEYSMTLLKKQ